MHNDFSWLNEPPQWSVNDDSLHVVTADNSDFWRETWYGFTRHSGHFYYREVSEDFTFQVKVNAEFSALYDQAGIMIAIDEQQWLKSGIEFSDGQPMMGSVLTVGHSDWATGVFPADAGQFWMRITLKNGCLRLQYSADGISWPLLRLCRFPQASHYRIGVMCCTPERAGLSVIFSEINLTPALDLDLHDLS